jgi:hypothetical protein
VAQKRFLMVLPWCRVRHGIPTPRTRRKPQRQDLAAETRRRVRSASHAWGRRSRRHLHPGRRDVPFATMEQEPLKGLAVGNVLAPGNSTRARRSSSMRRTSSRSCFAAAHRRALDTITVAAVGRRACLCDDNEWSPSPAVELDRTAAPNSMRASSSRSSSYRRKAAQLAIVRCIVCKTHELHVRADSGGVTITINRPAPASVGDGSRVLGTTTWLADHGPPAVPGT